MRKRSSNWKVQWKWAVDRRVSNQWNWGTPCLHGRGVGGESVDLSIADVPRRLLPSILQQTLGRALGLVARIGLFRYSGGRGARGAARAERGDARARQGKGEMD